MAELEWLCEKQSIYPKAFTAAMCKAVSILHLSTDKGVNHIQASQANNIQYTFLLGTPTFTVIG